MYNRYIPAEEEYVLVEDPPAPENPLPPPKSRPFSPGQEPSSPGGFFSLPRFPKGRDLASGLSALLGRKEGGGISGLLRSLGLEDIDAGDVLLLLIILYLLVEGDDLELVIALGLTLLMGPGEKEES